MSKPVTPLESPKPPGLHVTQGVTVRIPVGGLVVRDGPAGRSLEVVAIALGFNPCIHWLEIALEHLAMARIHHEAVLPARRADADFGDALKQELKEGMQAAVAAATFFEALYAATREYVRPPPRRARSEPCKRTARYKQVAEQLRRAFGLRKNGTANLRQVLGEVYRFRDAAVHPSAGFTAPVSHPALGVLVEPRFVMFGFESGRLLVRAALAFCKILPSRDMRRCCREMQELGQSLLQMGEPLFARWEQEHGPLLDDASA